MVSDTQAFDLGNLFLGEAARGVNPRLGRPVTKEDALAHVQRCRDAGLVHLMGRNKLDRYGSVLARVIDY